MDKNGPSRANSDPIVRIECTETFYRLFLRGRCHDDTLEVKCVDARVPTPIVADQKFNAGLCSHLLGESKPIYTRFVDGEELHVFHYDGVTYCSSRVADNALNPPRESRELADRFKRLNNEKIIPLGEIETGKCFYTLRVSHPELVRGSRSSFDGVTLVSRTDLETGVVTRFLPEIQEEEVADVIDDGEESVLLWTEGTGPVAHLQTKNFALRLATFGGENSASQAYRTLHMALTRFFRERAKIGSRAKLAFNEELRSPNHALEVSLVEQRALEIAKSIRNANPARIAFILLKEALHPDAAKNTAELEKVHGEITMAENMLFNIMRVEAIRRLRGFPFDNVFGKRSLKKLPRHKEIKLPGLFTIAKRKDRLGKRANEILGALKERLNKLKTSPNYALTRQIPIRSVIRLLNGIITRESLLNLETLLRDYAVPAPVSLI